jgi:hypothetical protein
MKAVSEPHPQSSWRALGDVHPHTGWSALRRGASVCTPLQKPGRALTLIAVMAACLFGFAASAWAATDTVMNSNDAGSGSLREVIATAGDGDAIVFDSSLDGETIELTSGAIGIDKSLTIEGPGASELTINAGHNSQIFTVAGGDLSISGLTLADGAAPEEGGAIYDEGTGSLSVSDCAFTGNTAGGAGGAVAGSGIGHGGAIYVSFSAASLSVSDCTFTGNTAGGDGGSGERGGRGRGGAIDYHGAGALTISGSAFTGNAAGGNGDVGREGGVGRGGAIFLAEFAASTSVSGSTFTGNTAGGDGGGGNLSGRGEGGAIEGGSGTGPVTVTDSTLADNAAGGQNGGGGGSGFGLGGAIRSFGSLTITGSTFADNTAGGEGGMGFGGAISNFDNVSPLTITGSTFTGNTAGGQGGGGVGGAINASSVVSGRSAFITNSTLVGNAAGGGGGTGWGGAIEATDLTSLILASVTISGNAVGGSGSGAAINSATGAISRAAAVTAKATIVSGNTGATNCDAPVASSSYSLEGPSSGDMSCGFDLPSADPQLAPLADNGGPTETQALPASSPAVDAVPVAKCPTKVDQRGEPRPDNGKSVCDVGAFELQDPPVAPAITSAPAATFQVGKAGSFTVTGTGLPAPDLSLTGALPSGVGFTAHGDGTATLSGTPAAGTGSSYPITIKAANGALPDAEQSFTLTVQASPTASIATPVDGATYIQGQAIGASFSCAEGTGGPGIASCVDQDGRPSGTPLDTAATGPHTFTVTATSKDGLTGRTSVAYMVVAPVTPKVPPSSRPRVLVSYRQEGGIGGPRPSLVVTKDRRARVTLGGCTAKFALGHRIWNRLRAALRGTHLHAIAGNYPPLKGSADAITYVIRASGEVVRIAPPQPEHEEVMRDLWPLLKVLNKTVSAGERRMPSSCKSSR